jgi:hypothetical protein
MIKKCCDIASFSLYKDIAGVRMINKSKPSLADPRTNYWQYTAIAPVRNLELAKYLVKIGHFKTLDEAHYPNQQNSTKKVKRIRLSQLESPRAWIRATLPR